MAEAGEEEGGSAGATATGEGEGAGAGDIVVAGTPIVVDVEPGRTGEGACGVGAACASLCFIALLLLRPLLFAHHVHFSHDKHLLLCGFRRWPPDPGQWPAMVTSVGWIYTC